MPDWLLMLAVAATSALLTGLLCRLAVRSGFIDRPTARSSHSVPTPRGGGLAIVLTSLVALAFIEAEGLVSAALLKALGGGGLAVAIAGFVDDRWSLPPAVRLLVHLSAGAWCLFWLGGLPSIEVAGSVLDLGRVGFLLGVLGIVWALNLFNFMDGIDGIAATEAIFVTAAGAIIQYQIEPSPGLPLVLATLCAACAGFLLWNWPPARIFMGDVGSGYLGFMIAGLAVAGVKQNSASLWMWMILTSAFFVDATTTLVRRSLRGERVYEAHRTHAYQWLARKWGSHRNVTLALAAVNAFWLFPAAYLAARNPSAAGPIALVAYVPVVFGVLVAGAGRPEHRETSGV